MPQVTEKDVPVWARSMVDNYRRSQKLPERVTDRMIFARIEECGAMDQSDIEAAVGDLIKETAK